MVLRSRRVQVFGRYNDRHQYESHSRVSSERKQDTAHISAYSPSDRLSPRAQVLRPTRDDLRSHGVGVQGEHQSGH